MDFCRIVTKLCQSIPHRLIFNFKKIESVIDKLKYKFQTVFDRQKTNEHEDSS